MIDFGSQKTINSVMIVNTCDFDVSHKRIGTSHLRLGNDPTAYSASNPVIRTDIVEGGFFNIPSLPTGRYLTLRRNGSAPEVYPDDYPNSSQVG